MKNVLVTGASSGIGAKLAQRFAGRGARIGMLALEGADLDKAAEMAKASGAAAVHAYGVDVRDRAAVRQAIAAFAKDAGALDIFIGCAGVDFDVPIGDTFDAAQAEFIYDVNFRGLLYSTNAALEWMLAQGEGHIVGIASLSGLRVLPIHSDYSASKCAVQAYLESLRIRLQGRPITVTTVDPGFVRTPMTAKHSNPMPFAVEAEDAARRIMEGIDRREERIAFPWPLVAGAHLLRALPDPLWRLAAKLMRSSSS